MKGHIRERSPGHWAIVLEIREPTTGRRKRKWHAFTGTKRQAQDECARLISELNGGLYIEPRKITVGQFLDRWLEHIKPLVSPRTHERYGEIVSKNLKPLLGAVLLTKLRPMQISEAYAKALSSGRRDGRGGLAPSTVRYLHVILKAAMRQAVRWQILARNPVDVVDPPKIERAAMTTYDLAQTAELIDATRGTRMTITVILAVLCGLRRGEIAALRWRNIDLGAAQLAVTESAEQTRAGVRYKKPKSGKGRTVALSARVVNELRGHRVQQAQELLNARRSADRRRFCCCPGRWQPVAAANHHPPMASAAGEPQGAATHSLPRFAARSCDPYAILWRASQDRQRAARALEGRDHDGLYSHVLPGCRRTLPRALTAI